MEEQSEKRTVANLIEKATNSTAGEVDPRLLKAIKFTVRYSDSELRVAAQTLVSLMRRDHSQVCSVGRLREDECYSADFGRVIELLLFPRLNLGARVACICYFDGESVEIWSVLLEIMLLPLL